jgi:hypothetical protein
MASDREHPSDSFHLAERLIGNLPGVLSARINAGPTGEITEVHVLTDHNRSPKQIVRDVESALLTGFGLEVDHKRISVAQLRKPEGGKKEVTASDLSFREKKKDEPSSNGQEEFRLRFDRFELISSSQLKCRAEVILVNGRRIFRGVCEDTDTRVNQMKISSKAVLGALEEYLGGEKAFTLEELRIVNVNNTPVVLVVVGAVSQTGAISLVGTSFIREDRNRSAALATLKAVNRYLGSG